ncbi:MAG: ATP-binding protein [Elusimicrobia bacterium]|nr:ATP-binding protein [Elusimicrobiota bacterium]
MLDLLVFSHESGYGKKATLPCPCGWRGHPTKECVCAPPALARYLSRLSRPLLDRIDLQVEVAALPFERWAAEDGGPEEGSAAVRARVEAARERQRRRFQGEAPAVNADIAARDLRRHCALRGDGIKLLAQAARRFGLSARSLDRILRVARTIADLEDRPDVSAGHLSEAVHYRCLERWQPRESRAAQAVRHGGEAGS